jgi:flagellar basal-body rod modification protein FlgD
MQINNNTNTTGTSATTGAPVQKAGVLGKDDFLKILVGQLKHMDPMNAQGSEEFVGQMTQMTMLEQVTNMAAANGKMAESLQTTQSVALLGKTVGYASGDGWVEGVVERVELNDGQASLTVAGKSGIALADVSEVR